MNNARRKTIEAIVNELQDFDARIEAVQQEEQEAADMMSENFPESERTEAAEEAASELDNAHTAIQEATTALETAMA